MEGVTRVSEPRSSFVPDNNPGKGEWYWVDVPALAQAAGLPPETQLVEVRAAAVIDCSDEVAKVVERPSGAKCRE